MVDGDEKNTEDLQSAWEPNLLGVTVILNIPVPIRDFFTTHDAKTQARITIEEQLGEFMALEQSDDHYWNIKSNR
jgi:hypothetical protein